MLLQSFRDEFELNLGKKVKTPAVPGSSLTRGNPNVILEPKRQTYLRSGIRKMIHMMQWLRSAIFHSVCDMAKHMKDRYEAAIDGMHRTME